MTLPGKKNILFIFSLFFCLIVAGQVKTYRFKYGGRNVFLLNTCDDYDEGHCVSKILVNGKPVNFKEDCAIEVKLDSLSLSDGDSILLQCFYNGKCSPYMYENTTDIPWSRFVIDTMFVDTNYVLHWSARMEKSRLMFTIEIYECGRWIKAGETSGTGTDGVNDYTFQLLPHSGLNEVRIKQVDYTGRSRISPVAKFVSKTPPVYFTDYRVDAHGYLHLTASARYEIFDNNGKLLLRGTGKDIDCSGLSEGGYFLCTDNRTSEFHKNK